ncbi:peptidoglycan DD-metalloendopeptidase family protein [Gottfriedia solisilvae]|uniref:M23 family metallopeptidase n=1 Tax=Gottfriedia solisilvae TaxID=1516104 RepID=UPI003D2EEC0E
MDKKTIAFLSIKNPTVLVIVLVLFFVFSVMSLAVITDDNNNDESEQSNAFCSEGNLNIEKYMSMFKKAGAFTNKGDVFISSAQKYNIDPVILGAIAFNETGRGKSKAVNEKNNPGGLMNPATGSLFVFATLDEGIDVMAKNLNKNYFSQGLVTIEQIGNKYAPIGASNDPTNLNANWIPNVTSFANKFGGLSMNCSVNGTGEFSKPIQNGLITSKYGYRDNPFGGGEVKFHKGIDFACTIGQPVFAAKGGKVVVAVLSGYGGGFGHHVVLSHGDKLTLYGHMTDVLVRKNGTVTQGQQIGTCGSTGSSTGPHVHFEVQLSLYGQRVDPAPYFVSEEKTYAKK